MLLTHWGRVTHKCVGNLTIIGSDNGLSPDRRQAIIWTSDGILLIEPLGTNFSGILISIETFSFKKMLLKMSSGKCRPFCLGLNVLTNWGRNKMATISQTTFSKAFSWMKNFTEICSLGSNLQYSSIGSDNGLLACGQKGDKPLSEPMVV